LWSVAGQETPEHYFHKPWGLWVSVEGENDWKEWCTSEDFQRSRLQVENVIELKPDANLLRLRSPGQLDEFTKQYGVVSRLAQQHPGLFTERVIDWPRVAGEYQGILIAPYQWSRRMERTTSWYYGWDCASGCIWDVDAIEGVKVEAPVLSGGNEQ